jgi:hypothetical protein
MVGLVDEIAGQSDAAGGLERRQRPQGAQGGRVGQDAVERGELVGEGARGLRGLAELGRGQGFRRRARRAPLVGRQPVEALAWRAPRSPTHRRLG